jgi:hypothetical protein
MDGSRQGGQKWGGGMESEREGGRESRLIEQGTPFLKVTRRSCLHHDGLRVNSMIHTHTHTHTHIHTYIHPPTHTQHDRKRRKRGESEREERVRGERERRERRERERERRERAREKERARGTEDPAIPTYRGRDRACVLSRISLA